MKKFIALVLISLSTAVFAAAYKLKADAPSAEFIVDAQSDSTGTTMVTLRASAYANPECAPNKYGAKLGRDFTSGTAPAMKPVRIAANETFAFTVAYSEARFGETRACLLTGSFTPLPEHRYRARVVVSKQATQCEMGVFDMTENSAQYVDFHMPEFVCGNNRPGVQPNGKPVRDIYQIFIPPVIPQ